MASTLLLAILLPGCGGRPSLRIAVGEQAPEFSLPALDGARLDSRSLLGRAMVLNFWATWCQACRREIPDLIALANAGGAEIIGVALDQEGERAVRPYVERHGIPYTVLLGDQEVLEHFHGVAIPYTLVLGPDHEILSIYRGATSRSALERDLEAFPRPVAAVSRTFSRISREGVRAFSGPREESFKSRCRTISPAFPWRTWQAWVSASMN